MPRKGRRRGGKKRRWTSQPRKTAPEVGAIPLQWEIGASLGQARTRGRLGKRKLKGSGTIHVENQLNLRLEKRGASLKGDQAFAGKMGGMTEKQRGEIGLVERTEDQPLQNPEVRAEN